jgi:hypothetical protein
MIQAIDIQTMTIGIIGVTDFLSHAFSSAAQQKIEDKQRGQTAEKRGPKMAIEDEIEGCIHRNSKREVCFPAAAWGNGMRECAPYLEGANKKLIGGSIRVSAMDGSGLVPIKFAKMENQRDVIKLPNGMPDIRYRPRFMNWSCTLLIRYNAAQITPMQIANLINLAGFNRGIGDWRPGAPKNPGSYGQYKVAGSKPKAKK